MDSIVKAAKDAGGAADTEPSADGPKVTQHYQVNINGNTGVNDDAADLADALSGGQYEKLTITFDAVTQVAGQSNTFNYHLNGGTVGDTFKVTLVTQLSDIVNDGIMEPHLQVREAQV